MFISIIVPTREEARYLPDLFESLKKQTYQNYEVIVVDYMSTDGTPNIAFNYGATIIHADEHGPGYARNLGAKYAKGDIYLFLDADVILGPTDIEKALSHFKNPNVLLIHTGWHPNPNENPDPIEKTIAWLTSKFRPAWWTSGRFLMVRKDAFWEIGGFKNIIDGEDRDFGWRFMERFGHKSMIHDDSLQVWHSLRRVRKVGWLGPWDVIR